jgi:hypothetical protein
MTKLLEPHDFAEVFPPLDGEAFDALVKDIEARGQQEPIWVYESKILDGRAIGIEPVKSSDVSP